MSELRCFSLTSVEQLRDAAPAWDDLWWRSATALPTVQAELLAQWIERFKPRARFCTLVVADAQRWLAALPLVGGRAGGLISAGELPDNEWATCGDLLVDASIEPNVVMERLLEVAGRLPWPLLWLGGVMPETSRWRAMMRACRRVGASWCYHEWFRAARVEIDASWDDYQRRLPKNHRQAMNRCLRRLRCEGDVQFEMTAPSDPVEIERWLDEAFHMENRGWKGMQGTSVLRRPGMASYFAAQAEQLARWGQLRTASLRLDGRLLAFVYGCSAKGVYFTHKIGYDPAMAAFSPGQLLFHAMLERLHEERTVRTLDFFGPINQALSRWRPESYGVGRLAIAPRRLLGRLAVLGYRRSWQRVGRWKELVSKLHEPAVSPSEDTVPEPAGAPG
ncbi:MAG: GNAT family N-acetyltransferase [Planctomycetaceae bacterium]|nr:GNAT family N-acetyltransferase [Planctomycetaceae bacterium]